MLRLFPFEEGGIEVLHQETVAAGTLVLIQQLIQDNRLDQFNLVGGTALALQMGHRISVDIDLFSQKPFDSEKIKAHLSEKYNAADVRTNVSSLIGFISDIKIDLATHRYPDVKPVVESHGIRMASLEDIAAMKFNAMVRNPTRLKDYIDIYYLLERRNMQQLTEAFLAKSPNVLPQMAHSSLMYHAEIDFSRPVKLLTNENVDGKMMTARFQEALTYPQKTFTMRLNKLTLSAWDKLKPTETSQSPKRNRGKRI